MVRVLQSYRNHETAAQRLAKIIAKAQEGGRPSRTVPLPRSAKQLREEEVGQILTAWYDGQGIAAIVRSTGWDQTTIRKYLRAADIDTKTNPAPNQRDREILRLHEAGQSTRQIAAAVGCSHSTVSVMIRKYRQAQAAEAS